MANRTLVDVITAPLVRKIVIYALTMLAGAAISWAVQAGWLDAAGGEALQHAINQLINAGAGVAGDPSILVH